MSILTQRRTYGAVPRVRPAGLRYPFTFFNLGDLHFGDQNNDVGDPNERQLHAVVGMPGTPYPYGGYVERPGVVIQGGDSIHDNPTESIDRLARYYSHVPGQGLCPWPAYLQNGNHHYVGGGGVAGGGAAMPVVALIQQRHGSLTWGFKLGPVYFQSFGDLPTVADVSAVQTKLNARPAGEPMIFLVHRSISSEGYRGEWDPTALTNFMALASTFNVVCIMHAHSHYSDNLPYLGKPVFAPGSVKQAPAQPPYQTTYPESFLVCRIWPTWLEVASYIFGFNVNRVWTPGTWEWARRVSYTSLS